VFAEYDTVVMGTGPNSKPVYRYRYFSTSRTGISVWGRYSIERWTIVYSGTKLGVKNSKKNTQKENVRLLKRLHTIGLAMFVWTPNSNKSQMKHTGYIVSCVCKLGRAHSGGEPLLWPFLGEEVLFLMGISALLIRIKAFQARVSLKYRHRLAMAPRPDVVRRVGGRAFRSRAPLPHSAPLQQTGEEPSTL